MEVVKMACGRENGNQFDWKEDFWNLREMLRIENFGDLKLIKKTRIQEIIYEMRLRKIYLRNQNGATGDGT